MAEEKAERTAKMWIARMLASVPVDASRLSNGVVQFTKCWLQGIVLEKNIDPDSKVGFLVIDDGTAACTVRIHSATADACSGISKGSTIMCTMWLICVRVTRERSF
jgi:hypothetical protein